jgi:hypothetical protein
MGYEIGYLSAPLGQYRWRTASLMSNELRLLRDYVLIYEILLKERRIQDTQNSEVVRIVLGQLYASQRQLAYLERRECSSKEARRRLLSIIRQWPLRFELYIDLLKTYVVAGGLRRAT